MCFDSLIGEALDDRKVYICLSRPAQDIAPQVAYVGATGACDSGTVPSGPLGLGVFLPTLDQLIGLSFDCFDRHLNFA